ncbi:hypothetical protein BCY88_38555 [Paraburkholderia fungorum]|uniref:Carrier domain-containing protein n=1 Tax=Paraburkholderia fungorum TaxID=134537 RepID=A0A3R7HCB2_9BURK|nr:hypothetical protein BCY88_38555 [Paraburkholderia fungorum]
MGPDVRVGIAVERSVEMVVGLLAIMKAGGAYVPFDPSYPAARLAYMMADSGISLLLTQRRVHDALPLSDAIEVLELDALDLAGEPSHNPDVELRGENLAYVIYTSGSTGQPKGAANRHSALYNRLVWMQQAYALDATDTVLQKTPFSFDVSVWEFFWPLMTGARLAVAAPDDHRDPQKLVELIGRHAVTTLHFVPSMLQAFIAYEGAQQCTGLRRVICSGEALSTELKDRALAALPAAALYNLYGPTEAAIDVTHWTCQADDTVTPIGRPIANVQTVVLDASLNMTPVGVAGELYLGGAGLARGYLNRSALTAERFVPDPFSTEGARLYRTGDLARWRADGALEYLGRIDHQVKIRGFRIELGEIEAQLLAQANVREAVVVAHEGAGGKRLVGYVSADANTTFDTTALREALAQALPEHMVPSTVIVLDTLPLSPNGKVDRKALPAPEQSTTANQVAQNEAPEGAVETTLAAIWQEVLGVEQVGRHANFFELGGDSIIAMQVSARIRATLDNAFALRALFTNPTLAALAPHIGGVSGKVSAYASPIEKLPRTGALPLSPAQRRLWIAARLATHDAASYNVTATVKLDGALSAAHVQTAFAMLTARHETLRASYPDRDGQPYVSIAAYQVADFVSRDLSALDDDAQRAALDELAKTRVDSPFDVTRGPLMRATLIQLAPQRHRLMLSLHHLICDGWSMGVLVDEFSRFYRAAQSGVNDALPAPLDVQYVDYAAWHRQQLDGLRTDGLRAFWRERLDGASHVLDLPLDFPRPTTVSQAGDSLHCTLDPALARKVHDAAQRYRVTPFVVLLASYQLLLHRLTGSRDVLVGTDVAGRERVELEALIGFFVNVVPLRSRIEASDTGDVGDASLDIGRWLAKTSVSAVSALEHAQLPLDQIVDTVNAMRDRRRNPLIQALFVLQNTPATTLDLPGITSEMVERPTLYSKFDTALFIEPHESTWRAEWVFSTALFRPSTIQRWSVEWLSLLENIVTQTEIHANIPPRSADANGPAQAAHTALAAQSAQSAQQDKLAKLKKIASRGPRAPLAENAATNATTNVESAADTTRPPARVSTLQAGQALPAVCEPWTSDVDPHAWARQHRAFIDATLARHGTILFRGFNLNSVADFEAFAEAMSPGLYGGYGDLPKKEGGRNTYRSTPYPEREMILFHNESSHLERWPRKQWFYCELPSKVGGATPIVDCREMLRRLPASIVNAFREKHLMYIRTFTDRLDVAWQDFFGTEIRADVEARLRAAGIAFRWLPNDGLQTRTICPGVITHPVTGELAFFNQVQLHHPYFLRADIRADLLKMAGPDRLPRNVCYGDGTPIDEADLAIIGEAYEACAVRFEWRAGDVVMLDNMLVAHARDPYEEPRKIVVAMGAMVERDALAAASVPAANADEIYP